MTIKTNFFIAVTLLAITALNAQNVDLSEAARQMSAEFRKKKPTLDFRSTLAVARFNTGSKRLQVNSTADLVKASFEKEFMRSVYFEVVERENLEKIVSEIELQQKGLTTPARNDGLLKSAEYLLVGELSELEGSLAITARLIDAKTGSVIATAQAAAPLDSAERAANALRYSAFQSPYGISLGTDASLTMGAGETKTAPGWINISAAYRVAKYLRLGAGISNMWWNEFVREQVPASGNNFNHYRNYNLSGIGPRIFADILVPVHPRLNLGLRGDTIFMPGMKLEQDIAEIKSWEINSTGTISNNGQRVIVTATGTGMTIFKPSVLAEFLISSRLSIYTSIGYMLSTRFRPQIFEANGERHWTDDIDFNGTFAKYQNYNFARRSNGDRVEFEMNFVFIDIGISLHF